MLSVQSKLAEGQIAPVPTSENVSPITSKMPGEAPCGKTRAEKQAVPADAMHTAFAWLFGSGCF